MADPVPALRSHLGRILDWEDAHVGLSSALKGLAPKLRGAVPPGAPHSPWQITEHLRLAQADILEFCVATKYMEKKWPADYWPNSPEPPSEEAWDRSAESFRKDVESLKRLAADPKIDLFAVVPNGKGDQTYVRELLLVADHNAYHAGQLVLVRRLLGDWRG